MENRKIKIGNFLFKYRSFTPVPLIVLVFIIFKPVNLEGKNILVSGAGLFISLFGEFIRVLAVGYSFEGTSGRETYLRADSLNVSGIYSIVRNPLYIGNFFIFTGLVVVFSNFWAVLVFGAFLVGQYYFIILAEENFLKEKYGADYHDYCSHVRRILPTFRDYEKNRNLFNFKKVIFKEKTSVFNLLALFLLILLYKERVFTGFISKPFIYVIPGCLLIAVYIIVRSAKQKFLDPPFFKKVGRRGRL